MTQETRVQFQVESYQRQEMVFDTCLLNTRHDKVQIKGKWNNPVKEIVPSFTPWCSSY